MYHGEKLQVWALDLGRLGLHTTVVSLDTRLLNEFTPLVERETKIKAKIFDPKIYHLI